MPKRSRKNQEITDLADKIRKGLGDNRPKSFGLYVKLIKEFGEKRVNDAFWRAVARKADDKTRYFLGILSRVRDENQALRSYRSLRAPLLKQMSPKPQWREKEVRSKTKKTI